MNAALAGTIGNLAATVTEGPAGSVGSLTATVAEGSAGGGVLVAALVPLAVAAVAFVGYCLFDLYRAQVRYLPKWAWALICLAQTPGGGIVYLCVGRVGRSRSASPSPARQP